MPIDRGLAAGAMARGFRWNVPPEKRSQAEEATQTEQSNGAFGGHWRASDHNLVVHCTELLGVVAGRMNSLSKYVR